LDRDLTFAERFAMRVHEIACAGCRRFRRQLVKLRKATEHRKNALAESQTESLSDEQRERIVHSLLRSDHGDAPE
jgi:predicted Fe-S protein YdhL (DUF1289 family)